MKFYEMVMLLKKYGLDYSYIKIIKSKKEIKDIRKREYPIVMKINSNKIIHKSDAGGVITNIKNKKQAEKAFDKLAKIKGFEGAIVQKQEKGYEVVIGMKRDEQFGPVLMFGLGGIFIEVMKDVSFRVCPITKKQALEMIKEIKGYEILRGIRGRRGVNIKKIVEIMTKLSKLAIKEKSVKEIDLNPIIANEKKAVIVDARIIKG